MAAARALNVGQPREMRMFRERKDLAISVMVNLDVFMFDNVKYIRYIILCIKRPREMKLVMFG